MDPPKDAWEETIGERKLSVGFSRQYPLTILIAEDNPVNQKLAVRILSKLGYAPDLAKNGLEVLEAMKLKSYQVILMNIQMPAMAGPKKDIGIPALHYGPDG